MRRVVVTLYAIIDRVNRSRESVWASNEMRKNGEPADSRRPNHLCRTGLGVLHGRPLRRAHRGGVIPGVLVCCSRQTCSARPGSSNSCVATRVPWGVDVRCNRQNVGPGPSQHILCCSSSSPCVAADDLLVPAPAQQATCCSSSFPPAAPPLQDPSVAAQGYGPL